MYSEGEKRVYYSTALNPSGLPGTFTGRALSGKGCPKWIQIRCQAAVTDPLWVSSLAKWTWSQLSHNINATSSGGLELPVSPSLPLRLARESWHQREAAGQGKLYPQELPPQERPSCHLPNLPCRETTRFQTHKPSQLRSLLVWLQKGNVNKRYICLHMLISQVRPKCHSQWHFFPYSELMKEHKKDNDLGLVATWNCLNDTSPDVLAVILPNSIYEDICVTYTGKWTLELLKCIQFSNTEYLTPN